MTEAWRIDSLDVEAGFAFASYRPADLAGAESMPADRQAVYIVAPYFSPEAMGSRAPGLAAARGRAQLGLFLGEREVGFDTLEALTEFVRRAYVAGSGGGGPEGEAPAPGEPPGGGGGPEDEAAETREPEAWVQGLIDAGASAAGAVERLAIVEGDVATSSRFEARWTVPESAKQASAALVAGGLTLAHVLLANASAAGDRAGRNIWLRSAICVTASLTQMGLYDEFRDDHGSRRLRVAAMALGDDPDDDELASLLDMLIHGHVHYWDPWWSRDSHDPLDDLADWPVNSRVARVAGLDPASATALGVLGALTASPQKFATAGDRQAASEAAAVFLFCAAHIVSWSGDYRGGAGRWLSDGPQILFERAAAWIRRQWPQLLFPGSLEGLIEAAAKRQAPLPMAGA